MVTPRELRKQFLEKASPLIDEYIGASLGTSELQSNNSDARTEVWDTLKKIILLAQDVDATQAKSISDLIEQVSSGTITISDAKEMASLFHTKLEIEEIPKLREALEKLETK